MAPRRSSPPTSLARASAAILLATVTAAAAAPAAATAPSFVVVLLDDLDELLNGTAAMPNVAALLRAQGTSLRGFVDVPICCPSRTSTLSGRYSHNLNNTALGWCGDFEAQHENRTWVQRLRAAGYATGLFGKYYNAYASFCEANVKVPSDWTRFFTMCDDNNFFGNAFNDQGAMLHVGKNVYMTDVIANKSLEWLATAAADPAPFFAYVAPHAPHVPATPAHKYENAPLPQNATRAPRTPSWDAAAPQHHWVVAEKAPLTPALIDFSDELWARRLRATMSVDDLVGDLLALLQAAGRIENTYIFFTSDHGYNLGQLGCRAANSTRSNRTSACPLSCAGRASREAPCARTSWSTTSTSPQPCSSSPAWQPPTTCTTAARLRRSSRLRRRRGRATASSLSIGAWATQCVGPATMAPRPARAGPRRSRTRPQTRGRASVLSMRLTISSTPSSGPRLRRPSSPRRPTSRSPLTSMLTPGSS
jgi:arylsulfatase A-like enzyme